MSSSSAASPELVIKIAKVGVYTELTPPPAEVATAPEGVVTESFGPTQAVLTNAHVIHGNLNHNTPYQIKAGTPHNFHLQNMHFIEKLPNGGLLFRATTGKTA
jgi:hypothetical protein